MSQASQPDPSAAAPSPVEPEALLEALDDHPTTPQALADVLGTEPGAVLAGLEAAEADGLAVCWGEIWATTWRAKLALHPGAFRWMVPVSLAVGATITALALTANRDGAASWLVAGVWGLAVAATAVALVWRRGAERASG